MSATTPEPEVYTGLSTKCPTCVNDTWSWYRYTGTKRRMLKEMDNGVIYDEGEFSHSSCDLCHGTLSGNRFIAHSLQPHGAGFHREHLSICFDCIMEIDG